MDRQCADAEEPLGDSADVSSMPVSTRTVPATSGGPLTAENGNWATFDGTQRVLVRLAGDLDILNAAELRDRVCATMDAGAQVVVIDMHAVTFMDSAALGALVGCLKHARRTSCLLRLSALQSPQLRVLEVTGLDKVFSIFRNGEEARDARP